MIVQESNHQLDWDLRHRHSLSMLSDLHTGAVLSFLDHQAKRGLSPNTISRRRTSLLKLAAFVHPASPLHATTDDIEEWIGSLPGMQTKYSYLSDAKGFYKWAYRRSLVPSDPASLVDPVRVPKRKPHPLSDADLINAITTAEQRVRWILLLAALAGLRRAEIASLAYDDINYSSSPPVIVVRQGKGNRDRVVPLHPILAAEIPRSRGWVFPSNDSHLRPETVGRLASSHLRACGATGTLHWGRHWFATAFARASNGNLLMLARILGHTSTVTTMGYTDLAAMDVAPILNLLRIEPTTPAS